MSTVSEILFDVFNISLSIRLPNPYIVFQAEKYAISVAAKRIIQFLFVSLLLIGHMDILEITYELSWKLLYSVWIRRKRKATICFTETQTAIS